MNRDLHNFRDSYQKDQLLVENTADTPFEQFSIWFEDAETEKSIKEPNAMTLATLGEDNFPKARIVLLKAFSREGFIFYTNYDSEKGRSILSHPQVGLSFFWPALERQVIIKGEVTKLEENLSDAYFKSRPKDSQLGALVSNQSRVTTREVLEEKMLVLREEFKDKDIQRPEHWGGFVVRPVSMEFWQGRPSRLHDRILYTLQDNNWVKNRLAP